MRNAAEVERLASHLIELSARHNFAFWLAGGAVLRGWARSALGDKAEGISWIENGIGDYRATGSTLTMSFLLALKAEALQLADRTFEALDAITEAEVGFTGHTSASNLCAIPLPKRENVGGGSGV